MVLNVSSLADISLAASALLKRPAVFYVREVNANANHDTLVTNVVAIADDIAVQANLNGSVIEGDFLAAFPNAQVIGSIVAQG